MRSQSKSSKRNARVSELTSEERHTIGNHLTAINGLVQLLDMSIKDDKSKQYVERLQNRLKELIHLWTVVTDPSRPDHQSDSQNLEQSE